MAVLLDSIQAIVDELRGNPALDLRRDEIVEGGGARYVSRILEGRGFTAAPGYVAFHADVDGVEIEWAVRPDAVEQLGFDAALPRTGRIHLLPFETALTELASDASWFTIARRAYAEVRDLPVDERLIPFDYVDPDSSGAVCVGRSGGAIGEDLHYFDHRLGALPLELTIGDYVAHLTRTRGIRGWQPALLAPNGTQARDVDAALATLFPGAA